MPLADKTKQTISAIVGPLAGGATVLLVVLVLLEYFRRGFVANFLDLRWVVAAVIVFWTANVMTASEQRTGIFQKILAVIILVFALYVIINLSLPFGRLGLVVIAAGIMVVVAFFVSVLKT